MIKTNYDIIISNFSFICLINRERERDDGKIEIVKCERQRKLEVNEKVF
jgi:hypothetical protein